MSLPVVALQQLSKYIFSSTMSNFDENGDDGDDNSCNGDEEGDVNNGDDQ